MTGAACQLSYDLCSLIAHGAMFGPDQAVVLHLFDIPETKNALKALKLELEDCSVATLERINALTDVAEAFTEMDVAIMLDGVGVKEGIDLKDILETSVGILKPYSEALEKYAKKTVKVLAVGNPSNMNAYILSKFAPSIPKANFSGLMRLDHNRALVQVRFS